MLPRFKKTFLYFCQYQQGALDILTTKDTTEPNFHTLHVKCAQEAAGGLPLNNFLLLPMMRITRYPLMLQEIIKHSTSNCADIDALERSLTEIKALCTEVNRVASDMENWQWLEWCQTNVRCDTLKPPFLFNSVTKNIGPRKFLHSGLLFKAKSGRILIGLLFNDIMMLTTPDEHIDHPISFKLSRTARVALTLYKPPINLNGARIHTNAQSNSDQSDECLTLETGDVNSNARLMWIKQFEKGIADASAARPVAKKKSRHSKSPSPAGKGRLLIEVVCVRQLTIPQEYSECPVICQLSIGAQDQRFVVNISQPDVLLSTQFIIESDKGVLSLDFGIEQPYGPDKVLGGFELSYGELGTLTGGFKRTPVVKQLPLYAPGPEKISPSGNVILKIVMHVFE